ncbi:cytochrome b/b6 domain-containing protein [Pseudomonas sp. DTU_2021_1001937_2_SI_NGA_ILE_001]|uniref:cytochrome b n=1 Tax=Pseudomonas sp. DTU_2021_1001937_2_SI_NGA_ILE_001 TaxID=3077589 RepID=UPI0028FC0B26|nr:cytochrome b/b6 domain-containing protein [Pseudomonas sp. DTU_2021_1001937_2_SI_NGA_ILE_001]WNW09850.1 cytochrome b/b6 domain-containing protein [Pseudomonas sp. DTU_2021_1001937_2_SI_NGA_ILE_001]
MKPTHFPLVMRIFHWLMAPLVLAMLLVGLGMVASVAPHYATLVVIHKTLGAALLVMVLLRIAIRLTQRIPALPHDMPGWQRGAAHLSHLALYALLLAQPLLGWSMQSAGGYPVVLWGGLELPALVSPSVQLHAILRSAHTWVAYALLLTILLHLAAALYHGLIRRDAVLPSMTGMALPEDPH